jgi:hypothetical protein
MSLLYVDVLGVKARWRLGGAALVISAYARLESMVEEALGELEEQPTGGGIQSDALALVFESATGAVRAGRALFADAFRHSVDNPDDRIWLRGVVSPVDAATELIAEEPFRSEGDSLAVRRFSPDLLRAINVEQSGTKGVRLLFDQELSCQALHDDLAIQVGDHRSVVPLKELTNSVYPDGINAAEAGYADVLWMIPDPFSHWSEWEAEEIRLSKALRAAGRQSEEFTQIAATALVFSEVAAILGSVGLRKKGGLPGVPGGK